MANEFDDFNPFDEDELFDDEYAQEITEESDYEEEHSDLEDEFEDSEPTNQEVESDAVTEFLKSKGINARSIKFESEDGEIEETDFNDLSLEEQLQILLDQTLQQTLDENDLSLDEINLLNQIRSNGWSVKEYNDYISKTAIEQYNKNNVNNYSISNIGDDELFLFDLEARYPDISNEEKIEELEHAKSNPNLYSRRILNLRSEYIAREQQEQLQNEQKRLQLEQQEMQLFVNSINQSIANHRYMDIGLGSDTIELSDEDMQDIQKLILGKDLAGNRYITNILNNPDNLVEAMWYISKGKYMGNEILDYYKHLIKQARQNGYKKGYDDAKSGRVISSNAVVSKRLKTPEKKREQTIYDLD